MKKIYLLLFAVIFMLESEAQQQILLLTESFDNPTHSFNLNAAGPGTNSGDNRWVVNDRYTGLPNYPNTPPQDSVVLGNIAGAPFSKYMHIHDAVEAGAGGVANANWNPNNASDRFTFIGSSFCTLGMTDVIFTFFWICEGTSDAYGELYYRIGNGPWTKTGQAKYNNQLKWKYESVQNPAFNNVAGIQFGFRWVNPGGGGATGVSFGIDDVIAVGSYNPITDPVNITIPSVNPTTVCQGDFLAFSYQLSGPLCGGEYYIELSDGNGNFGANPSTNQFFSIASGLTTGSISWPVPDNIVGNCFRIRIRRSTPPEILSQPSPCFAVQDCPESIITRSAPVMNDADTTCLLSAIDVKFNSFGVFRPGNKYTAQLSDSNGSFANPYRLGENTTTESFPSIPQGNVAGLIPGNVPPGCGYYIRVISSNPAAIGTTIGPFCLVKCDVLTNNHTDINLCVPDSIPHPSCTQLNIKPNQWDSLATYDTCNKWTIELRNMMNFGLVNSGGLGVYSDSIGGNFTLCVDAATLPVAPGSYYMRIRSNCSSHPWNQTGSVIRITIGVPNANPPVIIGLQPDTVFCNAGIFGLVAQPYNPDSKYWWSSQIFNNGEEFERPPPPNYFFGNLTGAPPGEYLFRVREQNYGCYGPYSDEYVYTIITIPTGNISGPVQVCLGDTVTFNTTFFKETYYDWNAPPGVKILDEGNSQVSMIFDTLGTFEVENYSLNKCGTSTGKHTVKVVTLYNVNAEPDTTICAGTPIELKASADPISKVFTTLENSTTGNQGGMFYLRARQYVTIDSFAARFQSAQPIMAEIYGKPGTYRGFEQNAGFWDLLTSFYNFTPKPVGQMTVIPAQVFKDIPAGDSFAFYITTVNTPAINISYGTGNGLQGTQYATDGVIDFMQGTSNRYPFGAYAPGFGQILNIRIYYTTKAGLSYVWNTGDTSATLLVRPTQTSQYVITVFDTSGCRSKDTVQIIAEPSPLVNAGGDTLLCFGQSYQLQGVSESGNFFWLPANELSNDSVLNPVFTGLSSREYILTAVSPLNGCPGFDTIRIGVLNPGPDTAICNEESFTMLATAPDYIQQFFWQPGDGLSNPNELNPVLAVPQAGVYSLTATTASGSRTTCTVNLEVKPCSIKLEAPQAFTPNGDGQNDYFKIYGKHVDEYQVRIYNRWGELVYNSGVRKEGLEGLSIELWDGTFKGKLQDSGTFVYYIYAKNYFSGEAAEKKGNLTLIR